jgi:hypothetical protein
MNTSQIHAVPSTHGPTVPAVGAPQLYYETTARLFDLQMSQIDGMDAKVGTTFAVASTILVIFAGLLSLSSLPANVATKVAVLVPLLLALAVYLGLMVALYRAYQLGEWSMRPDPTTLAAHSVVYDEATMRAWVADEYRAALAENEVPLRREARALWWAVLAVPLLTALLVLAGAISLVGR